MDQALSPPNGQAAGQPSSHPDLPPEYNEATGINIPPPKYNKEMAKEAPPPPYTPSPHTPSNWSESNSRI